MLCLCTLPGNAQALLLLFLPKLTTVARQGIPLAISQVSSPHQNESHMNLWRIKLFSSEIQYYWCYIALHNAAWTPQYLTGIRNHSVPAACQYHLVSLCPVFPSHMLLQEANLPAFQGKGSVFQCEVCEDPILCSVSCPLSTAPFT